MISQAVSSLRVGRGNIRRFRQSGSWGMQYSGLTGSGFHVILQGSGWLIADAEPVPVQAGDVILVPSGADHGISSSRRPLRDLPPMSLGLDPPAEGPADFEYLCGAYRLDRGQVHPFLAVMPELIVVSPDYDLHPQLRSVVTLLGGDVAQAQPGTGVTWPALLDLMLVHVLRQWLDENRPEGWPTITDPAITAALLLDDEGAQRLPDAEPRKVEQPPRFA